MYSERQKILPFEELEGELAQARSNQKRIVQCHGVFDLVHIGHIKHFHEAKKHGDVLVVTLTADQYVNKGPNRPAFNQELRAEAIASLECVDYVAINNSASAIDAIKKVKPSCYVKGKDYKERGDAPGGNLKSEETTIIELGGELVFTDSELFSSSNLLNEYFSPFPPPVATYLKDFRGRHSPKEINDLLDRVSKLKVAVVGEAIIDEYCYCDAIGKAGKEPVLVTQFKSSEQFAGGTLAIANHLAGFCGEVGLICGLGGKNNYEQFIRENLRSNVVPSFFYQPNRPTIVKRRYVEGYLLQKLFEVCTIDDDQLSETEDLNFCRLLESKLSHYDVVIVADYGHGLISSRGVDTLCDKSKFLAINTQTNASNRGFSTVSKYPRADYVSLSWPELCLDARKRNGDVREMILNLTGKFDYTTMTITRGRNGITTYDKRHGFADVPGFTSHVVDRIGSGDAVLSVSAPFAALGVKPELLGFIGNVAGTQAVKIVGHRSSLDRHSFMKHATALLK